jgi:hypothetical protein
LEKNNLALLPEHQQVLQEMRKKMENRISILENDRL